MMDTLEIAAKRLDALAVRHAPVECEGMRLVTLQDPPGVYYILGTDNMEQRSRADKRIQLIFLDVPEMAEHFAIAIGYAVEEIYDLSITDPDRKAISAMLRPT